MVVMTRRSSEREEEESRQAAAKERCCGVFCNASRLNDAVMLLLLLNFNVTDGAQM